MNTLQRNEIFKHFSQWKPFVEYRQRLKAANGPISLSGSHGFLDAYLAYQACRDSGKPVLIVVPGREEADNIIGDLRFSGVEAKTFPWWQALPYRPCPRHSPVFSERVECLSSLLTGQADIVVSSLRAALSPLPPPDYLRSLVFGITLGQEIDAQAIAESLIRYGYQRVPRVSVRGEFALRGEVLDIWAAGDQSAIRVVFGYDKVEAIKRFDPESQASISKETQVWLYPMKEVIWDESLIQNLRNGLSDTSIFADGGSRILGELEGRAGAEGEELFYPLAFKERYSLLDYLDPDSFIFFQDIEKIEMTELALKREFKGMYKRSLSEWSFPPPELILLPLDELKKRKDRQIRLKGLKDEESSKAINFACEPARSFFGNVDYFKEELGNLIKLGYRAFIFAETELQAQRIGQMLKELDLTILDTGISCGFCVPDLMLIIVREGEIFGRKKKVAASVHHAKGVSLDTFVDLAPGDYVVHVNYGIGRFLGIERMKVSKNERDYVKLEYADEETVFIPIEQVNLVQRYIGSEGKEPRLDRIGSKSWENRKSKVRKAVEDLAERLIRLYSRRKAAKGYAFPPDSDWQTAFEAAFPFEETEDQLRCVEEIKTDMEKPEPMDRMICGDVGFGKTEVAVRACFKSVMGGKQVAFLAPTTILAEQHFENFTERFKKFPVRVEMLSRLVEKKAQKLILERLERGEIDILVGTHRILQRDIRFKDLGLLVVDEEQRFGVKDKERLKEMKANIDCLTLTATPIPRTLHMSLLKIRDMSTLTTPPSNRQPVRTIIEEYRDETVSLAIRAEVSRQGQVFYLHNRIESLEEIRMRLSSLMPELMFECAHGQMDSSDLEDIMHRFVHGGFHVLISTTIIENGIDIPNVNTIIIDRADMYGISQLYQLRGRVGRSDRLASAFLLYPAGKALSELAMRRLQIISDFTELGSGFKIAMKDLEVRGAGNLLGAEQSGEIYSVGFELYLRLLDEAVRKLSDEDYNAEEDCYLELEYSGFIPDDYIPMPMEKMEVYKKIAGINQEGELAALQDELADRFGPVPEELSSLLALAEIRSLCRSLSIKSLRERSGLVYVEFSRVASVSVERLLRVMRESPDRIKLDPHKPNVIILKTGSIALGEKSEFIREKLHSLVG